VLGLVNDRDVSGVTHGCSTIT